MHAICHTRDIKVLSRQKHVKEIYIGPADNPRPTPGHSPLPLAIIEGYFYCASNSPATPQPPTPLAPHPLHPHLDLNKNITGWRDFSLSWALSPAPSAVCISSCQSALRGPLSRLSRAPPHRPSRMEMISGGSVLMHGFK